MEIGIVEGAGGETGMSAADDNVLTFDATRSRGARPPPLSDTELVNIRAMLKQFEAIKHGCPTARRLLREE